MGKNNQVNIIGEVVSDFQFSHRSHGEGFYRVMLEVPRLSDAVDTLPIIVSERLADLKDDWYRHLVRVSGEIRSHTHYGKDGRHVRIFVFAQKFEETNILLLNNGGNNVLLDGFICKKPVYRETPMGREIADMLLAVNRKFGRSDYLPLICWGRNAKFARALEVGTHIKAEGRVQSREYQKWLSETESETRTAYEVSVSTVEVVEDGK